MAAETMRSGAGEQHRETFERDGVVHLPNIVSADWLGQLRAVINAEMAEEKRKHFAFKSGDRGRFMGSQDMWRTNETCRSFCCDSTLPELTAFLLGSQTTNLFFDHLFVKEPGADLATSWHNDLPYWPIAGTQVMSVWVALDDVTVENGALTFLLGSHRWDAALQPTTFAERDEASNSAALLDDFFETFSRTTDTAKLRTFEMKAGDCLFFHSLSVHRAGGNRSADKVRRGYAIRYTGDDVTYDPRPGVHKMMLEPSLTRGNSITCDRFPLVWRQAVREGN